MGVALSAITEKTADGEVDIAGETVEFVYKPYVITLGMAMTLAEGGIEMIQILADVLVDWNLEANGKPLEVTEDTLKSLPIELAQQIAKTITSSTEEEVGEGSGGSFGG